MKKSDIPLAKQTLTLFKGDVERLRDLFPRQGASFMIRNLVRQFLRKVEEDASLKTPPLNVSINVGDLTNAGDTEST